MLGEDKDDHWLHGNCVCVAPQGTVIVGVSGNNLMAPAFATQSATRSARLQGVHEAVAAGGSGGRLPGAVSADDRPEAQQK
jgi:hypothetical protein